MKKATVFLNQALLALLLSLLLTTTIARTSATEPTLEDILDSLGFIQRTVVSIETFPAGTYSITMYAEYAYFRDQNQLRWYKVGTSDFNLIFDGLEGVPPGQPMGMVTPPLTRYFTSSDNFGLSLLSPDGTFYTETSRNPDGKDHVKIYQSQTDPNLYMLGFENMGAQSGIDFDYNDMVLSLEVEPPPIADIARETISNNMRSGIFGWNSGYDVSFVAQTLEIAINIHLVGDDPGDALRQQWQDGIEGIWSNKYDVVDGPYTYSIEISVDWVNTNSHHTVTVWSGTGRTNMLNWYTDRPSGWPNEYQDEIAAHEAGHMLGLYDEYDGGAVNPYTHFITTNSIMADLGPPREWHYQGILEWLRTKSGRDLSLAQSPLPPYPLNPPILNFSDPMMSISVQPLTVHIQPTSATIDLGQSVTFTSTVQGGSPSYTYQWYLDGNPVRDAVSNGWILTSSTRGLYYVFLQLTDSNNDTAQSETARIVVVPVPVGGYSIAIRTQARAEPLELYVTLIVVLTLGFIGIKRRVVIKRAYC